MSVYFSRSWATFQSQFWFVTLDLLFSHSSRKTQPIQFFGKFQCNDLRESRITYLHKMEPLRTHWGFSLLHGALWEKPILASFLASLRSIQYLVNESPNLTVGTDTIPKNRSKPDEEQTAVISHSYLKLLTYSYSGTLLNSRIREYPQIYSRILSHPQMYPLTNTSVFVSCRIAESTLKVPKWAPRVSKWPLGFRHAFYGPKTEFDARNVRHFRRSETSKRNRPQETSEYRRICEQRYESGCNRKKRCEHGHT